MLCTLGGPSTTYDTAAHHPPRLPWPSTLPLGVPAGSIPPFASPRLSVLMLDHNNLTGKPAVCSMGLSKAVWPTVPGQLLPLAAGLCARVPVGEVDRHMRGAFQEPDFAETGGGGGTPTLPQRHIRPLAAVLPGLMLLAFMHPALMQARCLTRCCAALPCCASTWRATRPSPRPPPAAAATAAVRSAPAPLQASASEVRAAKLPAVLTHACAGQEKGCQAGANSRQSGCGGVHTQSMLCMLERLLRVILLALACHACPAAVAAVAAAAGAVVWVSKRRQRRGPRSAASDVKFAKFLDDEEAAATADAGSAYAPPAGAPAAFYQATAGPGGPAAQGGVELASSGSRTSGDNSSTDAA